MSNYIFTADFSKFETTATKYNGENGLVLADCAKLAYAEEACIKAAMASQGFSNFKFFEKQYETFIRGQPKSTEAYIAGNTENIIVAFRGTQEPKDFLTNMQFFLTETPYGNVHHGFYKALNEVWDEMLQTIESFRNNNQAIWFCGHSLGAALATLAVAEYVLVKQKSINGLYTIGQPRTGNLEFAAQFDAKLKNQSFRFVNNADIVTRNPIPGLILKYRHIGIPLYIDGQGEIQSSISLIKKSTDIITSIVTGIIKNHKLEDFDDHKSENYVQLILKNRSKSFPKLNEA